MLSFDRIGGEGEGEGQGGPAAEAPPAARAAAASALVMLLRGCLGGGRSGWGFGLYASEIPQCTWRYREIEGSYRGDIGEI